MKNKTYYLLNFQKCWISSYFLSWLHFKSEQVREEGTLVSSQKCVLLHVSITEWFELEGTFKAHPVQPLP